MGRGPFLLLAGEDYQFQAWYGQFMSTQSYSVVSPSAFLVPFVQTMLEIMETPHGK